MTTVKHYERADGRGFTVNYKYLMIAYLIEAVVVATSLYGAYLFAFHYGKNPNDIYMMMLAPIAYACVELARVPLAYSMRVQTSMLWKAFFMVMVIAAAGVTVKSLSQLGEIMFRPRLQEVMEMDTALEKAKREQAAIVDKIKAADLVVTLRGTELRTAEERVKTVNTDMSTLDKPQCTTVSGTNRNGRRYTSQRCTPDPRVAAMAQNLKNAQESRDAAAAALGAAHVERAKYDSLAADQVVATASSARLAAVMHSQLHSFTGMFFGKAPSEVTDGEIHFFLRWFVFFPAIFAALTATALALASVTYDPKPKEAPLTDIDERASQYILEPLSDAVTERAVAASLAAVRAERDSRDNDKIIPLKGTSHG